MKVIYAGFPKTGTKTMNAALTELGFSCYDYLEHFRYNGDTWMKVFKKGGTTEDFRKMYENADACMDLPACFYWEEIHRAFPDAKIIFGMRKTEDEWWGSFRNQVEKSQSVIIKFMVSLSPTYRSITNYAICMITAIFEIDFQMPWFGQQTVDEKLFRKSYRDHNNNVLQNAPKDKLLVIDFEQGWEPLCRFLQVPVPDTPFPHRNKKGNIVNELLEKDPYMIRMKREMMLSGTVLTCLTAYGLFKLVQNRTAICDFARSSVNGLVQKLKR